MRLLRPRSCGGLRVVVAILLLGFLVVSCEELPTGGPVTTGAGDTTSSEVSVPATDTLPTSPTLPPTPTTEPLSTSSEERLPNGHIKACGIIKDVWVDGGVRKLKIDWKRFRPDG